MLYLVSAHSAHKPRRPPWILNATHGVASKQQPMQPTQEQEARHSAAPLLATCGKSSDSRVYCITEI
jgi:hypothetical protein